MSHDGKGLSALYARDLSSSSASANSGEVVEKRKRSRFDDVEEFNRENSSRREGKERRSEERGRERERSRDSSEYKRHRDDRGDRNRRDYEKERESYRERDERTSRDIERTSKTEIHKNGESYDRRYESDNYSRSGRNNEEHHRDRERSRESTSINYQSHERGYDRGNRYEHHPRDTRRSNVEIPFDKFLRLSPWRGPVTPLEERRRHLKNWDVAPAGFERIGADKAKMTGLFAPPGNITKQANYMPPTLDPARAAMLQLLNKDNAGMNPHQQQQLNYPHSGLGPVSDTSSNPLPAHLVKQAKRFYLGNLPFNVNEAGLLSFLESNLSGLSGSGGNDGRVLTINISTDRSYAFIECKTAEDATMAMNLDGVIYDGSQLKVRRPKEYHIALITGVLNGNGYGTGSAVSKDSSVRSFNSTTASAYGSSSVATVELVVNKRQLIISGVPDVLTSEHVRSLLLLIADLRSFMLLNDGETDKSLGVAIFEFVEDSEGEEWSGPFLRHSKGKLFMGPFEMKIERVCDLLEDNNHNDDSLEADRDRDRDEADLSSKINLRNLLSYYNLLPGYATAPTSTPILQLLNIVTRESLQADYENIYEDLKQEIAKHVENVDEDTGTSTSSFELKIPRPSSSENGFVPGIGKVFVKFGSVEEAARMANEVAGRIFDGKTCIVSFYPPEKYDKGIF